MLRVLLVITRGEPGGAQVHVRDLVLGLQDQVHYEVVIGDNEFLAHELRHHGIAVHIVPELQRSVDPGSDIRALRALMRLIRSVNPNLVHTHSTKAGLLGRAAARLVGCPAVHTAHAWSFSDGLSWKRKAFAIPIEAIAGRFTDRFIVVSEADREIALRYRVAMPDQVRVVHNGVTDTSLRARPETQDQPVICMVARMAAPKDHDGLLRALALVKAPCFLNLVGDGPDRMALEQRVTELGLQSRVGFTGVSREIPLLLSQAQIAVLCSRQEGFPLVVLEAMRAGLPVVASDVGGIREAVHHGETGLLVERGDIAGMAQALESLLGDAGLRARMGQAGRLSYERQFSVDQMVEATRKVYQELNPAYIGSNQEKPR